MSQQRLIALTGPARCGKNYAARLLRSTLGINYAGRRVERNVTLVGFADGLKAAVAALWPQYDPEDDSAKLRFATPGVTFRRTLEVLGAAARGIDPLVFVAELESALTTDPDIASADYVVVTDLRLPVEARWVRRRGGIVVQCLRAPAGPNGGHPYDSTQQALALDHVDYQLDNAQEDEVTAEAWRIILRDRGWL